MRFGADEKVIYSIHDLPVVQTRLGHRHGFYRAAFRKHFRKDLWQIADSEREQLAVPPLRVRVYAHHRLAGADDESPVPLTPEEDAAVAASKAAAARGEFATDEQVRAVWAKHGL